MILAIISFNLVIKARNTMTFTNEFPMDHLHLHFDETYYSCSLSHQIQEHIDIDSHWLDLCMFHRSHKDLAHIRLYLKRKCNTKMYVRAKLRNNDQSRKCAKVYKERIPCQLSHTSWAFCLHQVKGVIRSQNLCINAASELLTYSSDNIWHHGITYC